ncbi:MAG: hypothetical protein Q9201_000417 [Fulgogasparrea decipioides]
MDTFDFVETALTLLITLDGVFYVAYQTRPYWRWIPLSLPKHAFKAQKTIPGSFDADDWALYPGNDGASNLLDLLPAEEQKEDREVQEEVNDESNHKQVAVVVWRNNEQEKQEEVDDKTNHERMDLVTLKKKEQEMQEEVEDETKHGQNALVTWEKDSSAFLEASHSDAHALRCVTAEEVGCETQESYDYLAVVRRANCLQQGVSVGSVVGEERIEPARLRELDPSSETTELMDQIHGQGRQDIQSNAPSHGQSTHKELQKPSRKRKLCNIGWSFSPVKRSIPYINGAKKQTKIPRQKTPSPSLHVLLGSPAEIVDGNTSPGLSAGLMEEDIAPGLPAESRLRIFHQDRLLE